MDARKEQVRELLRAARGRIEQREVGLVRSRRQARGLRREDVAVLVGISVKWYTWLEQGRDVNFSDEVLNRVAGTLRLSEAERGYLFGLVSKGASSCDTRQPHVTESLWRTIQLAPVPTLAMTRRWDILAWNHLTARVFRDYGAVPPDERNLLRIILTDRKYQSEPSTYDAMIRRVLGEFRVDFGQCARDPAFHEFVAELMEVAPDFERHWKNVEVCKSPRGSVVHHDELGELSFDRISYVPEDRPFLRVLLFMPRNPRTSTVIASLEPNGLAAPQTGVVATEESQELQHTNRH